MSTPSTPAPEIAADVWQLRYLLCTSGQTGTAFVDERTVTKWDTLHNCQAYICKSKAEFDRRNREVVCKTHKRFFTAVELYNPATGERRKIDDTLQFILTSQAGQAAKSPGSYPGNAGSSPAPATTFEITTSPGGPAVDIVAGADDGFAKELASDWEAAKKAAFDKKLEATLSQMPGGSGSDETRMTNEDLALLANAGSISQEMARQFGAARSEALTAEIEATLSQTPGGSQSGGVVVEAAPCEPTGPLSDPPAVDADAGTPDPTASLTADASASPAPEPVSARAPASKPKPAASKKGKK